MRLIEKIKNTLEKKYPQIAMVIKILNSVENIKTDESGSLYIKMKNNIVLEANGTIITYTKYGYKIDKAYKTHINPPLPDDFNFDKLVDNYTVDKLKNICYRQTLETHSIRK